ncbi:hypothetical protein COO60DRAFT_1474014 [Scenedesmus sp. NREL 46B-D3]|nr:hypothetical protein COO60DRAFT_1474014 [Scenedesmus sp. NREL 46B-D3]
MSMAPWHSMPCICWAMPCSTITYASATQQFTAQPPQQSITKNAPPCLASAKGVLQSTSAAAPKPDAACCCMQAYAVHSSTGLQAKQCWQGRHLYYCSCVHRLLGPVDEHRWCAFSVQCLPLV